MLDTGGWGLDAGHRRLVTEGWFSGIHRAGCMEEVKQLRRSEIMVEIIKQPTL
jgi:hypothetical protein